MHSSTRRVLLAEDDLDDQAFFKDFLKHRTDIEIMPIAENGVALLDALEELKEEQQLPHLIILDQNMPKCNGVQTLQILKSNKQYAHIPVIVYSTYADESLKKECIANGALRVMTKPITKEGYDKIIDVFLEAVV